MLDNNDCLKWDIALFDRFIFSAQWSTDGLWYSDTIDRFKEKRLISLMLVESLHGNTLELTIFKLSLMLSWAKEPINDEI